jgi:hypothetical protein
MNPVPGRAPLPVLSPEQLRNRRRRNIAIALAVGLLVAFVYTITIVKVGPGVMTPDQ